MPAPTVVVHSPPPINYFAPGILRPQASVAWSGGVGPFDVLHEWDTDIAFGAPIQDLNAGATSPNTGTPPSDMGPAGTAWHYRVKVTDTSDATSTTSGVFTFTFHNPIAFRRYLYQLANIGVAFDPIDTPAGGWGPDAGSGSADGFAIAFRRYLYQLANIGVGFTPQDDPAGGWGPDPDAIGPDGDNRLLRRYHYQLASIGVGFDPIDGTDWGPAGAPGDGEAITFRRYLYQLANIDATVPTPHIWYVHPDFGREGWEFTVVGFGFGATQATYNGEVLLNALGCSVIDWQHIAESGPDDIINPDADIAQPAHQEVRAVVPVGAESGLVYITTDA